VSDTRTVRWNARNYRNACNPYITIHLSSVALFRKEITQIVRELRNHVGPASHLSLKLGWNEL